MNAETTLQPGHVVAGRYRVERQIGEGGVGSVYLVRHVHTDEELALKVLQSHALKDAGAVERFRREARAPARIGSEHVTRVTDADTAPDLDNAPFLVMELLRGSELTQVIAKRGPLPPPVVVELLRQAGRALDKAHSLGIVHRDLKPDNMFLTEREDGTPCIKLLDFGIARIADVPEGQMRTQAGLVFGTPGYMAPEQMTGQVDLVSPASDVWALGLVTFYLLAGRDFWAADTLTALYAAVLNGPIPAPSAVCPSIPPSFDAWFLRAVARDPKARFQTAGEAVTELAPALGLRASSLPPPRPSMHDGSSTPPPPPAATSSWMGVALPATGLLAGLAVAAVFVVVAGVFIGLRVLVPAAEAGAEGAAGAVAQGGAGLVAPAESSLPRPRPAASTVARPPATAVVLPPEEPAPEAVPEPVVVAPREPAVVRPVSAYRPGLRRDQQERLDALQRLCDQGTVTQAECAAKRLAILRGDP